jgi:hypothetical protein
LGHMDIVFLVFVEVHLGSVWGKENRFPFPFPFSQPRQINLFLRRLNVVI